MKIMIIVCGVMSALMAVGGYAYDYQVVTTIWSAVNAAGFAAIYFFVAREGL